METCKHYYQDESHQGESRIENHLLSRWKCIHYNNSAT